jgi:DNA-binding NtrC family response regulator
MAIRADRQRNYSGMFDSNIGKNSRSRTVDSPVQRVAQARHRNSNKRHDIDLVLSDIVMPGMSRLELGRLFRKHHPEIPVALVAGEGTATTVQKTSTKSTKLLAF